MKVHYEPLRIASIVTKGILDACFLKYNISTRHCNHPGMEIETAVNTLAIMNITWTLDANGGRPWPYYKRYPNGTVGGFVGGLINGVYDIVPIMVSMTPNRVAAGFHYSYPLMATTTVAIGFVIKRPTMKESIGSFELLVNVLRPHMWLAFSVLFLLLILAFTMTSPVRQNKGVLFASQDSVFQLIKVIFEEYDFVTHRMLSSRRLVLLGASVLSLMWEITYNASLLETLINEKPRLPFNTMKELAPLVANGKYRLIREEDAVNSVFWQETLFPSNPDFRALNKSLEKHPVVTVAGVGTTEIVLDRIQRDPYLVLVSDAGVVEMLAGRCDLMYMPEAIKLPYPVGFLTNPRNPIAVKFGERLASFGEMMGYLDRKYVTYRYKLSRQGCPVEQKTELPLGLIHLSGIMWLCSFMYLLAVTVIILEAVRKRCNRETRHISPQDPEQFHAAFCDQEPEPDSYGIPDRSVPAQAQA